MSKPLSPDRMAATLRPLHIPSNGPTDAVIGHGNREVG